MTGKWKVWKGCSLHYAEVVEIEKVKHEKMCIRDSLEWYPGERIEIIRRRDRIQEVIFKTLYKSGGKTYVLNERYGYGYITNELYQGNTLVNKAFLRETEALQDLSLIHI